MKVDLTYQELCIIGSALGVYSEKYEYDEEWGGEDIRETIEHVCASIEHFSEDKTPKVESDTTEAEKATLWQRERIASLVLAQYANADNSTSWKVEQALEHADALIRELNKKADGENM